MKLKIRNFGPLTKGGTIDLDKRFYVFVGRNGSGKTYLANLVYGVSGFNTIQLLKQTNIKKLELADKEPVIINEEDLIGIDEINIHSRFLRGIFGKKDISFLEKTNIKVTFSYKDDFLARGFKVGFLYEKESKKELYTYTKEKNSNRITFKQENISVLDGLIYVVQYQLKETVNMEDISRDFWGIIFPIWIQKSGHNIFLPANRTSLLSLWRYIASTERKEKELLFDINSNGKLLTENQLQSFQPLYTQPVKDLINTLEKFDAQSSKPKDNYPDLVEELEKLMGGKIKVHEPKEGIGRKRFTFEMAENGEELELFLASSAVNQLSTLYIFLKYWAEKKRNFLMIDEPEINLHPENQVKLVNILMKFADRNDNRVLITTHSTLLADIINNHVRIGYLQTKGEENTKWLKNHQLDINENITYKDFGVYHFTGNAIEEYPVGEYGVAFKGFNKVIKEVEELEDELKDQIYNSLRQEEN